jgi:hypothetical protein
MVGIKWELNMPDQEFRRANSSREPKITCFKAYRQAFSSCSGELGTDADL